MGSGIHDLFKFVYQHNVFFRAIQCLLVLFVYYYGYYSNTLPCDNQCNPQNNNSEGRIIPFYGNCEISQFTSHGVMCRDSMKATIPSSLIECYKDQSLLVKDNLLPMTMPVLIDLIRKVERHQGSNMNIRTLTTVLLQRFRLDGIERDPAVPQNEYVTPYKPSGSEFYKYMFIMDSLIPNQNYIFPNDSLTMVEQCTLHFMLSSSVDRWARGDEGTVCNRLSNYVSNWKGRIRRQVQNINPATHNLKPDPDAEIMNSNAMMNDMARRPSGLQYQQYYPRGLPQQTDYAESNCPVENGVVYTKYGAVKAGVVLAGIAAGLQPQSVSRRNLVMAMRQQGRPTIPPGVFSGGTDYTVSNKWAATLSGEVAEVALLQGPGLGQSMRVGLGGGWNNTMVPRYYFLSESNKDALTETDIRGGIDGLALANGVIDWVRTSSDSLKLSQLLDMYYSDFGVFDQNNRACSRKDRFSQIAPANTLLQEGIGFAQVLQYEQPSSVVMEDQAIQEFARIAASKLTSFISSMSDPSCPNLGSQQAQRVLPAADLYLVIDCIWEFASIQGILSNLLEQTDVNPFGSRVTLINGKDGYTLVNTTNYISEFQQNFNFTYYNTYNRGFDLASTLKQLQVRFEVEMNGQKQVTSKYQQQNRYYDNPSNDNSYSSSYSLYSSYYGQQQYGQNTPAPGLPKVVVFIPSASAGSGGDGDSSYIRDKISYYRMNLPDVKLLYFVTSSKDRYSSYAENPNKDIFTLTLSSDTGSSIKPLADRIAEIPRPLANPTCGSNWVGRWYSTAQSTGYLVPNSIHYYKIHPNYFYKSTDARIRIQSQGSGTLTVCQSRSNPTPSGNRTLYGSGSSDVYCKQISSDTYEMRISEGACGDLYAYQCQPYYLSVSVSQSQSGSSNSFMCREDECRYPNMIKYTISHEGLTCYSSVIKIISNPMLLSILLISVLIKDYVP